MTKHRLRSYNIADRASGAYHWFGIYTCLCCREQVHVGKVCDTQTIGREFDARHTKAFLILQRAKLRASGNHAAAANLDKLLTA